MVEVQELLNGSYTDRSAIQLWAGPVCMLCCVMLWSRHVKEREGEGDSITYRPVGLGGTLDAPYQGAELAETRQLTTWNQR